MKTVEYYFVGIDCPNCAAKVENLLNTLESISSARVNFLSKKIIIEYLQEELQLCELEKIISKLEPDVKLSLTAFEDEYEHHKHEHECEGCCHDHNHDECQHEHCHHDHEHKCCCKRKKNNKRLVNICLFITGLIVGISAFIVDLLVDYEFSFISRILYVFAFGFLAYKIIIKSVKNIIKGNIFDENLLMLVASIGALIINEGLEAILVVLLYTIGEYFQDKALGNSTDAIASLTKLKVDVTHLVDGTDVLTKDIKIGDEIIVKVGERIPLDGVVISGESALDTKVITGESMPQDVRVDDVVLSGCINLSGVLHIKVTNTLNESTTSKIIRIYY